VQPPRLFLLSPASVSGARANLIYHGRLRTALDARLRSAEGAEIGEVFAFLSGLYFRGKLAYAREFVRPPLEQHREIGDGVLVITAGTGLRQARARIGIEDLEAFRRVDLRPDNPTYRVPLETSAAAVRRALGPGGEVVLLGSVATAKYIDVLAEVFGDRLLFPAAFVGRGDMSRGGLLLRSVSDRLELDYIPALGAIRHGPRPPRLEPLTKG
jgi:hypothetical protein